MVFVYKSILDENKRKKSAIERLSEIKSDNKKDYKMSVENWQYRKKIDKLIKKLESKTFWNTKNVQLMIIYIVSFAFLICF